MFSSLPAEGPDSRRSFVTAALLALVMFMCTIGMRSAGFFYVGILETLKVSREEATWPLSVLGATTYISGVVGGAFCHLYSPRPVLLVGALASSSGFLLSSLADNILQLTITLGLVHGFGNGLVVGMAGVFITQHFIEYRAVGIGMIYGGSTFSSFVFPPSLLWLNGLVEFRYVLLAVGVMLFGTFALGLFVHEPDYIVQMKEGAASDGKQKKGSLLEITISLTSSTAFYVLLISHLVLLWAVDVLLTTLVDFAGDNGCTLTQAVDLLSWFSVTDFFGRVVMPIACDKGFIKRQNLITIAFLLCGVGFSAYPLSHGYWQLIGAVLFQGVFMGTAIVLFTCMAGDFVGVERFPIAIGIFGCVTGSFFFLKPKITGHFRDEIKSYDGLYWACVCLFLLVGIVWIAFLGYRRLQEAKKNASAPVGVKDVDALGVSASNGAPATVEENLCRVSTLPASSIPPSRGLTYNQNSAAKDNPAYVAEEISQQRL